MKRPIEAIIEDVITEPSKVQPIIVNFQNGELEDGEAKKMSCGLFYDKKKQKTLLALSNGQIVYKGYKPNADKELTRTMLVLHNRKTGKVRLVQAERWQVNAVLEKPSIPNDGETPHDKIAMLNKQFGSKKMKRRTEQYERMKVNIDSVKEQLEQTVSNVDIDRLDLSTPLPEAEYITNTLLPPCNRDATNVKDVYNVYDIVPESKLDTLKEVALEILENGDEGKSKFFTRTLKYLKSDPDKVKKAALLIYIQAVATWLEMPIKNAKKRVVDICPYSEEINNYVVNTYSVQSAHGRARPTSMKDKGVIHCIILGLIIFNFELNLDLFATIINYRIGLKKFKDLARVVGAVPSKDDKNVISLKLPLPAEPAMVKKGKKK